jgi:hypothetical protein
VIYLLFAALVGVAWQISRMGLIRPNDDIELLDRQWPAA